MGNLEYQIDVDVYGSPKKFEGINLPKPEERLDYDSALYLTHELGVRGIHYQIIEIDKRCGNRMNITSKMLRMPKRQRESS